MLHLNGIEVNMQNFTTRRTFLGRSAGWLGAAVLANALSERSEAATHKEPRDFIIVEGHRDIWEFNARFAAHDKSQWSPLRDFLAPRLIESGLSVVIMPCGGDSIDERGRRDALAEGSLRTLDMLLTEIEKTNGKVSVIRTKADVPQRPNRGKVQIFLDMEGGASISDPEPEPEYNPERRMALLRQFFRLGMRGLQLTHNGRNMLGQGVGEGKMGTKLSEFGVAVVKEMNCLGMMVGVSHLSANAVLQVAELSTKPIVSTHQNLNPYLKSPLELLPEEVKAIASTGGICGVRYISNTETPYTLLAEEIEHLAKTVGVEHTGISWLGHDVGNPAPDYVPGVSAPRSFSGIEAQTMLQHWENFIAALSDRGFTDDQIGLILGGNYLRIWKQILPVVDPAPTIGCTV
jgi:membrane dipeptidase